MKRHYHFIWFGAFMCLNFTLILRNLPTEKSNLFSGSGNCTLCHSGSGDVLMSDDERDVSPVFHWQASMMANAAKDPYWQAKVSSEVEENPHLQTIIEDKCATCHAPMGRTEAIYNGQTHYTFEAVKSEALSQDGVSCTLCHQIDDENLSKEESFSGHYLIKDNKTIHGPYENPFGTSMVNNTGYTPVHGEHIQSSALCATCHTLSTPYVDHEGEVAGYFPEQMPYYEWLNSDYPSEGKSCQSCHMPALKETMKIASMPSTLKNMRSPIFEHQFVGGNTIINRLMQNNREELNIQSGQANMDTTALLAIKNLKENSIELETKTKRENNMTIVDLSLKNKTGHKLPTGFPSRRIWIHFTATGEQGDTIFESGAYTNEGDIINVENLERHHDTIRNENNVQIYEAVLGNTLNETTTVLLEASQYLKDNRLPPIGFTNTQSYDSLIAITGAAKDDTNFNKEGSNEGTGSDLVTYIIDTDSEDISYNIELCYQTIKPSFTQHLKASATSESKRFSAMYDNEEASKVEIIASLKSNTYQNIESSPNTENLTIGPNPTNGFIALKNITPDRPIVYSIYQLDGKMLEQNTSSNALISIHHLPYGYYVLTLKDENKAKSFKILHTQP